MHSRTIRNGDIEIAARVAGDGPAIVCVHGWPELWYSWRHQMAHFAARGYTVAALDVRGYGASSKPAEIAAYSLKHLAGDVAAVAAAVSDEPVILFGHDWGAPIVYYTSLLHPDAVRAVAGLSVPYIPAGDTSTLDLWKTLFSDRFFYQLYFQAEGVAERELEADVATTLRKVYFALSGDAADGAWIKGKSKDAGLLDGLVDPDPFPGWLTAEDLGVYVDAFERGGFRGPINRYRAQAIDHAELAPLRGRPLAHPSCFVGGARDGVRSFLPGLDIYATPGLACRDFRGSTVVPGAGHWVQQEAPDATNRSLQEFVESL